MIKDPDAELDFTFDWSRWLAANETITAFVVNTTPGITVAPNGKATSQIDGTIRVWLGGGTAGQRYSIACRVTTSGGRVDERTIRVTVVDR